MLVVSSVLVAQVEKESMCLPTQLQTDNSETIETNMLLDSGAGGVFIDEDFTRKQGYHLTPLPQLIKCKNVDGTPNKLGTINYAMTLWLDVHGKRLQTRFLVTRLGQEKVILGLPWLRKINPDINWSKGMLWFREPEAVTIRLVHTTEKAPYVLKRRPFKAEG